MPPSPGPRDPYPGKGLVVDEPDLLEPVEEAGRELVGDQLAGQLVGQLVATASLTGQLVEQDLRATDSGSASTRPRSRSGPPLIET